MSEKNPEKKKTMNFSKPPEEPKVKPEPKPDPKIAKLETVEKPPQKLAPVEETLPPPEGEPLKPPKLTPEEIELRSKNLMLKMGFRFAGNAMETYTDDPDMNLDDDELSALIEAWEPFIPDMPPWICAAIVTGTVFGKKFLIYKRKQKKKKEEKPKTKPEDKGKAGKPPAEAGKTSELNLGGL